jgi:hypothetical protein
MVLCAPIISAIDGDIVTVLVHHTYINYSYTITHAIRATLGLYAHIRFFNFTIMPPLTKGYEKISTVLIFIAVKILTRLEHQSRSVDLQFVHILVHFLYIYRNQRHLQQPDRNISRWFVLIFFEEEGRKNLA